MASKSVWLFLSVTVLALFLSSLSFKNHFVKSLSGLKILKQIIFKTAVKNPSSFSKGLHGHYGEWRDGLKYNELCNQMNTVSKAYRCCDMTAARHLHFEFIESGLNKINVKDTLSKKIQNKNIVFIGSSLEYQLFEAIHFVLRGKSFITEKKKRHRKI